MEWHWIVILVIDLQRLICNGCNGLVMDWDWIGGLPRYDYVCPDVLTSGWALDWHRALVNAIQFCLVVEGLFDDDGKICSGLTLHWWIGRMVVGEWIGSRLADIVQD